MVKQHDDKKHETQEHHQDCDELKAQLEEINAKYLRALADYQNLEKRTAEHGSEISNVYKEELIKKLLPVMDSLFHAVEGVQKVGEQSPWLKGVRLSVLELKKVLQKEGLEVIPTKVDDDFDISIHDAIGVKDGPDNKIMEITEMGYKLNGKILRPAKVIVGKSKASVANIPGLEHEANKN